jgi:hypothetical protein
MRVLTAILVLISMATTATTATAGAPARDVRSRPVIIPAVPTAPAGGIVEQYTLNAQYRGTVRKGFPDIGKGFGLYQPQREGRFSVRLEGTVHDPEDKSIYELHVDMDFEATGREVRELANRSHYSHNATDYRDRVERVIPFVHLVKFTRPPTDREERAYRFRGVDYTLRYMPTDRNIEATLYQSDTMIGKFFLEKGAATPLGIEKFRVPTEGNVVLSFVNIR